MVAKYRGEHIGSLLRPAKLLQARAAGAVNLREQEDACILRALARQQEIGLPICTDGEFRRRGFMSDFTDAVAGIDYGDGVARAWQANGNGHASQRSALPGVAVERLRQVRRLAEHESGFLRRHCDGPIKITLPSANQFPAICFKTGVTDKVYADRSALLWDIVPIIESEIAALAGEGVDYIQIDAPRYSYYLDPKWRAYIENELGQEPDAALDEAIRADNRSLAGARGSAVTLAIHLCRGNNRSQWYAEGGYDAIAEKLFNQLAVDTFLLEYDSERAGGFAPLRFMPKDKRVVLGLVSSKVAALESSDELKRRMEEASRYLPLENLALSPQCGFASNMEGNLLSEDDQWRKLELVVRVAREVWG